MRIMSPLVNNTPWWLHFGIIFHRIECTPTTVEYIPTIVLKAFVIVEATVIADLIAGIITFNVKRRRCKSLELYIYIYVCFPSAQPRSQTPTKQHLDWCFSWKLRAPSMSMCHPRPLSSFKSHVENTTAKVYADNIISKLTGTRWGASSDSTINRPEIGMLPPFSVKLIYDHSIQCKMSFSCGTLPQNHIKSFVTECGKLKTTSY